MEHFLLLGPLPSSCTQSWSITRERARVGWETALTTEQGGAGDRGAACVGELVVRLLSDAWLLHFLKDLPTKALYVNCKIKNTSGCDYASMTSRTRGAKRRAMFSTFSSCTKYSFLPTQVVFLHILSSHLDREHFLDEKSVTSDQAQPFGVPQSDLKHLRINFLRKLPAVCLSASYYDAPLRRLTTHVPQYSIAQTSHPWLVLLKGRHYFLLRSQRAVSDRVGVCLLQYSGSHTHDASESV